ncbi:hypothetical protein L1887_17396 [Cichorium endivia]|nr:hypothetical protein L1887_17396 [Cichorium endivia]
MLVIPVWAGTKLHLLITQNMDKLAKSLDGSLHMQSILEAGFGRDRRRKGTLDNFIRAEIKAIDGTLEDGRVRRWLKMIRAEIKVC